MSANHILITFIILKFAQYLIEKQLSNLNKRYTLDKHNQEEAQQKLKITDEDMGKSRSYFKDKFKFGVTTDWINITVLMVFVVMGGFGYCESVAKYIAGSWQDNEILVGLLTFAALGFVVFVYSIPFDYYRTFVIEEKHGFNKQTKKGFLSDLIKNLIVSIIFGAIVLSVVLWIMVGTGRYWWFWAWAAMSVISILTAWLYPTLLAPLFNKFAPLPEGELKDGINALAKKVGFKSSGLYEMDASKRSSHGNAYFTGVFGKKRIVLFDTLIKSLTNKEIVAVLAHELGHFKLHHVRWGLIRGLAMSLLTFYLLSLLLPFDAFYRAFSLDGVSVYGALIVFSMWFTLLDFIIQPLGNYISRRNEFAADRFAVKNIGNHTDLKDALLKLREESHMMPLSHPLYSSFYYSHPPLLERISAMEKISDKA